MDDTRTYKHSSPNFYPEAGSPNTATDPFRHITHSHTAANGRHTYSHWHAGADVYHDHNPESDADSGTQPDSEADAQTDADSDAEALGSGNLGAGIPVADTV